MRIISPDPAAPIRVSKGFVCPKCSRDMWRFKPHPSWKTTADHYYFLWDNCFPCGENYNYEPFRIEKNKYDPKDDCEHNHHFVTFSNNKKKWASGSFV